MAAKKIMRHASAIKERRKSLAHKAQNYAVRSKVRSLTAAVVKAISEKNAQVAKTKFVEAQSAWQKAVKTGVFHKNAASRKISRLASRISALAKA